MTPAAGAIRAAGPAHLQESAARFAVGRTLAESTSRLLWKRRGGVARFLFAGWAVKTLGPAFPYGTIAINAIGSFLIVIITQVSLTTDLIGPELRLALTTGAMGGFTTYSTFNYESISLFSGRGHLPWQRQHCCHRTALPLSRRARGLASPPGSLEPAEGVFHG
jgi:protein CrcB